MSLEAWGTPPDQEPIRCPMCDSDHYTDGCPHCAEVQRRCAAEADAERLRAALQRIVDWDGAGMALTEDHIAQARQAIDAAQSKPGARQ